MAARLLGVAVPSVRHALSSLCPPGKMANEAGDPSLGHRQFATPTIFMGTAREAGRDIRSCDIHPTIGSVIEPTNPVRPQERSY